MNIDAIKGQFKDYARSNLFVVRFSRLSYADPPVKPDGFLNQLKSSAMNALKNYFDVPESMQSDMINFGVKTTSIPSIGMNPSELEWRGFKMPTVGVPTHGDFSLTFVIDHDLIIYNYFGRWLDRIMSPRTGSGVTKLTAHSDLITNIDIYQVKGDLDIERGYMVSLINAYPINIGEISLTEDDAFSEFTVTFRYTHIKNDNFGEEIKRSDTTSMLDKAKGFIGGLIP